jgi:hypothetical protein
VTGDAEASDKRAKLDTVGTKSRTDGAFPDAGLIFDVAGNLYGTICWNCWID